MFASFVCRGQDTPVFHHFIYRAVGCLMRTAPIAAIPHKLLLQLDKSAPPLDQAGVIQCGLPYGGSGKASLQGSISCWDHMRLSCELTPAAIQVNASI